jgi:hypothetical protein
LSHRAVTSSALPRGRRFAIHCLGVSAPPALRNRR